MNPVEMGVSAVWGPRPVSLDAAAEQVVRLHRKISVLGDPYDRLYLPLGPGKPAAVWSGDLIQAKQLLVDGQNRRDVDHQVLPELGYLTLLEERRSGFWRAGVSINVGVTRPTMGNSVGISLPPGTEHESSSIAKLEIILDDVDDV